MSSQSFDLPVASSARRELTLADLAARVVAQVAPAELELLSAVTRAWLHGELGGPGSGRGSSRRGGRWLGGSIGIGLEPQLISVLIYPMLAAAFAPLLERGTARGARWLRRRRRTATVTTVPALTPAAIEQIRAACYQHGLDLGLLEPKAGLLADAVCGALLSGLGDGGDHE